ncbi:hypothetical protein ACFTAO_33835 [Paenibacillus rhizoplanae]
MALIERCYARGVNIVITQDLRTIAEQERPLRTGAPSPDRSSRMPKAEPVTTTMVWPWTSHFAE